MERTRTALVLCTLSLLFAVDANGATESKAKQADRDNVAATTDPLPELTSSRGGSLETLLSKGARGAAQRPAPERVELRRDMRNALAQNSTQKSSGSSSAVATTELAAELRKLRAVDASNTSKGGVRSVKSAADVRAGFDALSERAEPGLRIQLNPRNNTLTLLDGIVNTRSWTDTLVGKSADSSRDVLAVLDESANLIGLEIPSQELRLMSRLRDAVGNEHLKYQQVFSGMPVWGRELAVHLDASGQIYYAQGRLEPTAKQLDLNAMMNPESAKQMALADRGLSTGRATTIEQVVYYDDSGLPHLAYAVEVEQALDVRWTVIIDAHSGAALRSINRVHSGAPVSASGTDLRGQNRSFAAYQGAGNSYYMLDIDTPLALASDFDPISANNLNAKGDTYVVTAQNTQSSWNWITSASPNSGWDATAVSAAYNTRVTYDYYKQVHGRDSIDGNGMNLVVVVHFDSNLDNAQWNGTAMLYGDGGTTFDPLAKCLDVAAHEMSHGVIERTANLIYENQSGALNESFADVFGAMVDRGDWLMGEDCTKVAPGYLRSLSNPGNGLDGQPAHMSEYRHMPVSQDGGGVHSNSGIPNRAAYLVAEGLPNAIGRTKTEKIYYHALSNYLLKYSNFIDARRALVRSAQDVYPAEPAVAQSVRDSWDGVGVFDSAGGTSDDTTPNPGTTLIGSDVMVYLYPRDGAWNSPGDTFDIYAEFFASPFVNYDPATDFGPLNDGVTVAPTKPAIFTLASGTYILFVGADANVYLIDSSGIQSALTTAGTVSSLAVSPDGNRVAITTFLPGDNAIHVLDLVTDTVTDFVLSPQVYQQGATSPTTILYADAMNFSFDNNSIVFDALNCFSISGDSCDSGGGYRYWSIGTLNLKLGTQFYPFPSQPPIVDIGYPSFAYNSDSRLVFDVVDFSPLATDGVVDTWLAFYETSTTTLTDEVFIFEAEVGPWTWTAASPWGDDTYLALQLYDGSVSGIRSYRFGMTSGWQANEASLQRLNNYASVLPVMHRIAVRTLSGGLLLSQASLNVGSVNIGVSGSATVRVTNTANHDVNITATTLSGSEFTHNLANSRIPSGAAVDFRVTFTPATETGSRLETLQITSDGTPNTVSLSVLGNGTAAGGVDLSLSMAAPTVNGTQISVPFQANNLSSVGVRNVTVTGSVPSGTTFVSASFSGGSCQPGGTTITCSRGSIAAGTSVSGAIVLAVTQARAVSFTAIVSSSTTDPTIANNSATAAGNVGADLRVLATTPTGRIKVNAKFTIPFSVANLSSVAAPGYRISFTLPTKTAFVSMAIAGIKCVKSGTTYTCTIASLSSGAAQSGSIVLKSTSKGTKAYTLRITPTGPDPNATNNSVTVSVPIG